jgi:hypothetical protein
MEKQKLPNEQAIMILGIASFIGCCCTSGFLGVILSGIGLFLSKKSEVLLAENPDTYNLGSLNTWKIVNLISLILSGLTLIWALYLKITGKDQEMMNQYMEMMKSMQNK